jgi:hypothetical protein
MSLVAEILDALDALTDAADPLAEVAAVQRLERLVHRTRAGIVRNALASMTYEQVGGALGMTRQGVAKAFPRAADQRHHAGLRLPCEPCAGPCRIDDGASR